MLLTVAGLQFLGDECAFKKGGAGCASGQLHGLRINCAQGQEWEGQPLILTSIVNPACDVAGASSLSIRL